MATFRWLLPLPALPFRPSPTFRLLFSSPPPPCSFLTSPGLPNSFLTFQTPRHLLPFRAIHPQQQSGTLLSGSIFEEDDEDEEFEEEDDSGREFEEDGDDGNQKEEEKTSTIPSTAPQSVNNFRSRGTPPMLTIKEKKELASYAHSLGKKLKCQQVGKSGVTASVAASFVESLEANELLKLKVHGSCPGELVDVVKQLEVATGSVAVGQIGRTVILYRPSISKLKAAQKKRQDNVVRKRYSSRSGLPIFAVGIWKLQVIECKEFLKFLLKSQREFCCVSSM
ncbi:uncharacterized protein LOC116260290 isoform X1 [Nymphaea colorata]|nr:uncharacterized protein LOC116260290 isoform X1 [Nymphaea colorata]